MKLFIVFLVLALAIAGAIVAKRDKKNGTAEDTSPEQDEKIYSSQNLHEKLNEERRREGKTAVQAINNMGGANSGTMASQDKSWDNVADFFIKMGKGAGSEHDAEMAAKAAAEDGAEDTAADAEAPDAPEVKDEE